MIDVEGDRMKTLSHFIILFFFLSQVGQKDNPALDPIIHGLRGVVHHGE